MINRVQVRDGKPYPPATVEQFELLPGVAEACARLKHAGFMLIVVTNQPDVGRGTMAREVVEAIHKRMLKLLPIDRVEVSYASGSEEPPDECRKPRPGLIVRAAQECDIDLRGSFMVGDRWRDIDAGHAAGCQTIFVDQNYKEELRKDPDFRVTTLLDAAQVILALIQRETQESY